MVQPPIPSTAAVMRTRSLINRRPLIHSRLIHLLNIDDLPSTLRHWLSKFTRPDIAKFSKWFLLTSYTSHSNIAVRQQRRRPPAAFARSASATSWHPDPWPPWPTLPHNYIHLSLSPYATPLYSSAKARSGWTSAASNTAIASTGS